MPPFFGGQPFVCFPRFYGLLYRMRRQATEGSVQGGRREEIAGGGESRAMKRRARIYVGQRWSGRVLRRSTETHAVRAR